MLQNLLQNNLLQNNETTIDEKINIIDNDIVNDDKNILLKKISNLFLSTDDPIIHNQIDLDDNVLRDLNIFYDSNQNKDNSVFNIINNTSTLYGEYTLRFWLSSPTTNINILKKRQKNIKLLLTQKDLYQNITDRINNIINSENKILWFWQDINEDIQSLYDIVYFKIPYIDTLLNNNELILNISNIYKIFIAPSLTILTPIMTFIIPYILLMIFNKNKNIQFTSFIKLIYNTMSYMPSMFNILPQQYSNKAKYFSLFMAGIWVFLYVQSGYYSVISSMQTHKIINILHKKINTIANLIRNVTEIKTITNNIKMLYKIDEELEYFNNIFKSDIFYNGPKIMSNKGKILSIYHNFLDNKDKLINILKYIGEIDVYMSLAKLYNKFKSSDNRYCFAKYIKCKVPNILVNNIWHPNLNNNPHLNSIVIDKNNKNLLITGPNRAGKSIFIKSLAISILFSQTIGIVCASQYKITPFTIINSYLHIPDSTGHCSLFEAEMYRAKDHINMLKNKERAFIIMDEIFTSTNYVEGYSAAYAIGKKLSQFNNSVSIITTHFTGLNKLEEDTGGKIKNYKFSIDRDKDGQIIYTYNLERGYSQQYIALELLKDSNFDIDIIDNALKMCEELKKNM